MYRWPTLSLGLLILTSCFSDSNDEIFIDDDIFGTWQVVFRIDDIITDEEAESGFNQWEMVTDGRILEFGDNGLFLNLQVACNSGQFRVQANQILYNCDGDNRGTYPFPYEILDDTLTIGYGFSAEKSVRLSN